MKYKVSFITFVLGMALTGTGAGILIAKQNIIAGILIIAGLLISMISVVLMITINERQEK